MVGRPSEGSISNSCPAPPCALVRVHGHAAATLPPHRVPVTTSYGSILLPTAIEGPFNICGALTAPFSLSRSVTFSFGENLNCCPISTEDIKNRAY